MVFVCIFCPPCPAEEEEDRIDKTSTLLLDSPPHLSPMSCGQTTQPHHHRGGSISKTMIVRGANHARVSSLTPTINTMATTPTAGASTLSSFRHEETTPSSSSKTRQTIIRSADTFDSVLTEEEHLVGESITTNHQEQNDNTNYSFTSYKKMETYLENLPETQSNTSNACIETTAEQPSPQSLLMLASPQSTGSILILTSDSGWFPQPQREGKASPTLLSEQDRRESPSNRTTNEEVVQKIRTASVAWSSSSSGSSCHGESTLVDCEDRRNRIEQELSVIVQACMENCGRDFEHEFEDEAIEALGIAAMTVAYIRDETESLPGPSIAFSIVRGSLLEEASKHYYGKFDDFTVAYAPVIRSSIQRLKNNLVTETKYYDNNYSYIRHHHIKNRRSTEFSNTEDVVLSDRSNRLDSL